MLNVAMKAMDFSGTSDPYCVLQLGHNSWDKSKRAKTKIIYRSLEPTWRRNYSSQTCIPRSFTSSSLTTTRLEMMIS